MAGVYIDADWPVEEEIRGASLCCGILIYKVHLEVKDIQPQVIHSFITCKVSSLSFHVSFVYGFRSIVSRRPLWNNLMETTELHSTPWLLVGDFNSLLRIDEKWFGAEVSAYEVNDFMDCCQYIISD